MQSSHAAAAVDIAFDDPNLIADAGLVPVLALAERLDLAGLVGDRVRIVGAANSGGANAGAKVMSLLGGMIAGADSIEDIDRLRHAGMAVAFDGVRAPSTLGTFLRSFTHGHVRQLHGVHRRVLVDLAAATPLLPGAEVVAFVDVDSAIGEDASVAVDPADGGAGGDDAFQAFRCDSGGHNDALQTET